MAPEGCDRAEQGSGADALQRPLRSRLRARLTAGVQVNQWLDTPPGQWVGPKEWEAEGFLLALWGVPLNYIVG